MIFAVFSSVLMSCVGGGSNCSYGSEFASVRWYPGACVFEAVRWYPGSCVVRLTRHNGGSRRGETRQQGSTWQGRTCGQSLLWNRIARACGMMSEEMGTLAGQSELLTY